MEDNTYFCRYGRNVTERSMAGRTETEGDDDPGLDTVEELVKAGAALTKVSKKLQEQKETFQFQEDSYALQPLHHAAMRGNICVVEYLVKLQGVHLNCRDMQVRLDWTSRMTVTCQDSTPLHIAATYGNTRVAELLLAAGADTSCRDYQEQTPLHR